MTSSYIKQIIDQVNLVTNRCGSVLLYGENIDTGSRIAGLARGLTVNPNGKILNVGNCELAHCGVGFGIMIDRGNAVLFMKQLDFLLLGLDQIVNTFNYIRAYRAMGDIGSFTIFLIVCDQGYQGPQSSLNSVGEFASLANIDAFCLNDASEASEVVSRHFVSPGFRIIALSQRLFGELALETQFEWKSADDAIFRYRTGSDATVVCFNFALRQGMALASDLAEGGLQTDLFHVNYVSSTNFEPIIESAKKTGKLVLLDDSKSVIKFADRLVMEMNSRGCFVPIIFPARRGSSVFEYGVAEDRYHINGAEIKAFLGMAA